jgi:competence ComEA-like helix-hairpin-helix protein
MRRILLAIVCLLLGPVALIRAADLQRFTGVRLVDNPSNDADSFVVQAAERRFHVRLYFVDAPESTATTDADAKRVREQARYFGITDARKVFDWGREAKTFMQKTLDEPFSVYTSFASALGRSKGGRVYAFVTTANGRDFGELLIENGLGRAHGTKREGPNGESAEHIQRRLQDLEAEAMLKRRGIWTMTEPGVIAKLRAEQRAEDQELKDLVKSARKHPEPASVDLNSSTTQELQSISGIGPILAAKIIAGRPYKRVDDLLRVNGIGPRLLERIRPYLVLNASAAPNEELKTGG